MRNDLRNKIKLEHKILWIVFISGLLVAFGFHQNNQQSKRVLTLNKEVSLAIETQNLVNEMKMQYYAALLPEISGGQASGLKTELIETLAYIEKKYDSSKFEGTATQREILIKKIETVTLLIETTPLNATIDSKVLLPQLEGIQQLNAQIKLKIISEIRHTNTQVKTSIILILVALSSGIIGLLGVIYIDFLKPIREFRDSIQQKTMLNDKIHSSIQLTGINALSELADSYNRYVSKMDILNQLNDRIFAQSGFDEILQFIFNECKDFIPYTRIGVAVLSEDGKWIRALRAKSDRPIFLGSGYQLPLSSSSLSSVIASNEYRIINDLEHYLEEHPDSESTRLIIKEGMRSSITIPLAIDRRVVGVVFFSSTEKETYDIQHIYFLSSIANALTFAFEKSFVHDELILAAIKGFAAIVESKDHVTGNHIDRMSYYAKYLTELLYAENLFPETINERYIEQVYKFSALHDIGKVGIDDQILSKPGKLSVEEFAEMKQHAVIGHQILADMSDTTYFNQENYFKTALEITRHHHEKYDGSGYPDALKGEAIPLAARIVAIADVFDALTSERPYKEAFSFEASLEIIKNGSGQHFDPVIVSVLHAKESQFKKVYHLMKDQERII